MSIGGSDAWSPNVANPTRSFQNVTAGVTLIKSVQITNNTSWNLLVNDSAMPPDSAESARYVVPPQSTANFPLATPNAAFKWTGLVDDPSALITTVFSSEHVEPLVQPGVQAPGGVNDFARADTISRSLIPSFVQQGPFLVGSEQFYIAGAYARNPFPYDIVIWRNAGGAPGEVVFIIPAQSTAQFNIGDFTFFMDTSAPMYGLPSIYELPFSTVDFVFFTKPFTQPSVTTGLPQYQAPPIIDYQELVQVDASGFVVGVPIPLLTVPLAQMWCVGEIYLVATGQSTAAANPTFDYYALDVDQGFEGLGVSRRVGRFINGWSSGAGLSGTAYYHQTKPFYIGNQALGFANNLTITLTATGGHLPSLRNVTGHIQAWRVG